MKKLILCLLFVSLSSVAETLPANYHINCVPIEVGVFEQIRLDMDINDFKLVSDNVMGITSTANEKFILTNLTCIIQPLH